MCPRHWDIKALTRCEVRHGRKLCGASEALHTTICTSARMSLYSLPWRTAGTRTQHRGEGTYWESKPAFP